MLRKSKTRKNWNKKQNLKSYGHISEYFFVPVMLEDDYVAYD